MTVKETFIGGKPQVLMGETESEERKTDEEVAYLK